MSLETRRLTLVPGSPESILALREEPGRFETLSGAPAAAGLREFFISGEVSPDWLAALRKGGGPDPWRYGFFVIHREKRSVIGSAGFKGPPDSAGVVEIAYGIVPGHENEGYATEAATALIAFALADDRVQLLRAHTLPMANASTRVLAKCGFRHLGEFVDPEDGPVWRWERTRRPI